MKLSKRSKQYRTVCRNLETARRQRWPKHAHPIKTTPRHTEKPACDQAAANLFALRCLKCQCELGVASLDTSALCQRCSRLTLIEAMNK